MGEDMFTECLKEYHRQLESEHGKDLALLRASIMADEVEERFDRHYHRTIGATQLRTGYPYVGDLPALDKAATCDCAGREKLQDLGTLYYKAGGYHNCWYLSRKVSEEHGGYTQVTCPLCDRRLP